MKRIASTLLGAAAIACAADSHAHSASDAYLTLASDAAPRPGGADVVVVHGQWDIAIRDLDFVLKIDGDGDGDITWRELKTRLGAIGRYAYSQLALRRGAATCSIVPGRTLITDHADGTYVALFFDATCPAAALPVTLDYRLFFAIDPSHRAIVIWRAGNDTATAVLSPARSTIAVRQPAR